MFLKRLSASVLLIVTGLGISLATGRGLSDLQFYRAEIELGFWKSDSYTPSSQVIRDTDARLSQALRLWPKNPHYLEARATSRYWQSRQATGQDRGAELRKLAQGDHLTSLKMRPAHRDSWIALAREKALYREFDDDWQLARSKLRELAIGKAH